MPEINVFAWLGAGELPGIAKPPFIALGGTSLLNAFFDRVANGTDAGELWLCAPFIEPDIASHIAAFGNLPRHKIELKVLTSNQSYAGIADEITGTGWLDRVIAYKVNLHAKIFLFMSDRPERICLIGSHNLTAGGAVRNFEAGSLIVSAGADALAAPISELHSQLLHELRASALYMAGCI